MADDDSKIVIPVEIETDEAKKALDDLASTASETFNRVVAKQASNAGITPEEFLRRGRDFADNGPKYSPPDDGPPDGPDGPDGPHGPPPHGPRERPGSGGKEGHGVRYINVEQELLGESSQAAAESTAGIRLFREALHALHPALAEAGIGVGELSALVSAARGGFIALSVAIGTLVVTALERAGDTANDAASRLGAFAGGISAGKEQYGRLSETAEQLKTPTSGLVTPFEQATRLNQTQPQTSQLPEAGLLEGIANVVKGAQSERADTNKVLEALTKLLSDAREKGFLGPNDFKALENIAPRTAAAIEDKLPKGQSTFTGAQVLGAVQGAGAQINANSVEALKLPDSISTAWEHVKSSYERLAVATTGGHAISGTLDALATFFDSAADRFKKVAEAAARLKEAQADQDKSEGARKYDAILKQSQSPFVEATNKSAQPEPLPLPVNEFSPQERPAPLVPESAFNTNGKFDTAAEKSANALDKLSDSTESLQKKLNEFHITPQDALAAKSTDISLRQAEIERKFEPRETANKLERDKLSIQNADIHLESAKISGLEALKGRELSRLAPEEARERVASAQSNYDSARSKFLKYQGYDTTQLDAINARDQIFRDLDAAETALKRAKIEQKYAYLEEPKAKLAAEQSQTAIRSAELEKNDASLRFAKDTQTAPVSHELQQLKYSEALLKEEEQQSKYQGEMTKLLAQVLAALDKRSNDPEEKARKSLLEERDVNKTAAPATSTFSSQDYEHTANKTGIRTVEGDRLSREGQTQSLLPIPREGQTQSLLPTPREGQSTAPSASEQIGVQPGPPTQNQQDQLDALERDFKSQSDFDDNIARQNGGLKKLPPGGVSLGYPPAVPGHYDPVTQGFIPSNPDNVDSHLRPKTNDFDFAGKHNPFPYQPGISTPLTFPTYNEQQRVPLPQPRPPEADQSSLAGQQFATLGSQFQQVMDAVAAKLGEATAKPPSDQLPNNAGIRGDVNIDEPVNSFKEALDGLTGAIDDASKRIGASASDQPTNSSSTTTDDVQQVAGGGHIRGPGTSTSDSIPAMLSDGEFVFKEEAVRRIGVDNLHAMNDGVDHLAGGGEPKRKKRKKHHSQFTLTDEDRHALDDAIQQSIDDANADANATPRAASGGLVTLRGLVRHFSKGGSVGVPPVLQHFNLGGLASRISHATAPTIAMASGGVASSAPSKSEMEHWGTIDMRTNHGDVRVATERDTMRNVSSNAQRAKRYSTGPKPGWFGGRS